VGNRWAAVKSSSAAIRAGMGTVSPANPKTQYALKVSDLPWLRIPAGPAVARPEATRVAQGGNEWVGSTLVTGSL
jgi:hypothetical protein